MPQTSSGNMAQADAASGGAAENKQAPVFIIARVGRAHDGSGQVSDRKIHAIAQLDGDKIGSSQEPSFFYDDDIYVLAALGHTDSPGVCNFGHVSHVLVKYPLAADGVRQCIDQVQQISSMIKCATDKNVIPRMAVLSGGRILAAGSPANNAIEQQILDTIYAIEAEIPVPSPTTPVPPKSSLRMAYESVLRDYEQDVTLQNEALELSGVRELYGAYHLRATDIEQEIQRLKESRQLAEVTRGPKDLRSLGCLEKIKKEQISKIKNGQLSRGNTRTELSKEEADIASEKARHKQPLGDAQNPRDLKKRLCLYNDYAVLKNKLYSQEQCARPTVHIPRIPNMVVAWQIICKLKHGQHFTLPVKKCNGTFAMMHPVSATCIASGHVPTELFSDCGLAGNTFTTLLIDDDAGIFTAFDTNANTWELRHDPNFSWRESGGMCDTAKDVVEMQRNNPAAMVHDRPLRWNESYIIFDMNNVHVVFYFPLSLVELGPCIRAMLRISAARKDPECCIGGSTSNKEPILVTIDRRSGRIFEVAKIADLLKVSHIDESDQIVLEPDAQELVDIANAKVSSLLDQPRSTLCETAAIASSQNPCLIS